MFPLYTTVSKKEVVQLIRIIFILKMDEDDEGIN